MKNITIYNGYTIALILLVTMCSCNREKVLSINDFENKVPENVHLNNYTSSSITVGWKQIDDAASYTVQLLNSLDSDSPIDQYTTVSENIYTFTGLNELAGYYIRVRANFSTIKNPVLGDWVYVMDGANEGRIMPKYGFVDKDFEEPEPEPEPEYQLYPNFPEGWEIHDGDRKKSYTAAGPTGKQSDVFPSGEWLMNYAYTTNSGTALIHKVESFATMMANNQNAYLAMDFDLPNGAAKFSFICGAATRTNANETTGMPIILSVDYSQDGGNTWTKLGDDILIDDIEKQYNPEFDNLDIVGPVRFKISKSDSKARPIIDEVAVYYTK